MKPSERGEANASPEVIQRLSSCEGVSFCFACYRSKWVEVREPFRKVLMRTWEKGRFPRDCLR